MSRYPVNPINLAPVTRFDVLRAAEAAAWPALTTPNGEHLAGERRWKAAHLGYARERRQLHEQLQAMRTDAR